MQTPRSPFGGSHPKGEVNPLTLEILSANRLPIEGLRSKDWNEFSGLLGESARSIVTRHGLRGVHGRVSQSSLCHNLFCLGHDSLPAALKACLAGRKAYLLA